MNQEKIGQVIKDIRKKHNLTQADFANKYNVTYQAVSKWENGKNLPDISLIKQICNDFNINLNNLLEGEYLQEKTINKTKLLIIIISIILVIGLSVGIYFYNNNDFYFKTLSSGCENFNVSGSISYNDKKSSIYISNVNYCGEKNNTKYKKIECNLFEKHKTENTLISTSNYQKDKLITLEDFLKDLYFTIDNYNQTCKDYSDNSLFFEIKATTKEDKIVTYEIPLNLQGC